VLLASIFVLSSAAQAQATRTWVSGVGDDVNPCSRTAPCKTFAGAISKTAAGGEINALDPGGFGTVTITKSLTIDGGGTMASILACSTNGVIVNDSLSGAPNTINVTLRRLSINGCGNTTSPGLNGIRFISGKVLNVEDLVIFGFTAAANNGHGIDVSLGVSASNMNVRNTTIYNTRVGIRMTTTTGFFSAGLNNVEIKNSTADGILLQNGGFATVRDSLVTFSGGAGVSVAGGANSAAHLENTTLNHNNIGLFTNAGANARISNVMIVANNTGVSNSGVTTSFLNNRINGNTTNISGNALSNTAQQ
jgi:hypothetical protein